MKNPFLLPLRDSLLRKMLATTPPEIRKPKKPKGKKGGWNVTQPDGFILEIRRLKEQCGWTNKMIREWASQQGFPIDKARTTSILGYSTRSSLVPEITDKPYYP